MAFLDHVLLPLLMGFFVAVAGCGAFVWVYNRALCQMHETVTKKVMALALLPLGCVLGAVCWLRLGFFPVRFTEWMAWATAAMIGAGLTLRYSELQRRHRAWLRGSRFRRVGPGHGAINWRAIGGLRGWLLRGFSLVNGVLDLRVHHRRVPIPGLPRAFEGYRIVHVTDLHVHKTLTWPWYQRVVEVALAQKPDVLLFGGDFISKPPHVPDIPRAYRRLSAPDGVWFVRGNHDFWKGTHRITRLARACGMRLLDNRGTVLRRGGEEIALIGLEVPYVPLSYADLQAIGDLPSVRIGLVHDPIAFRTAEQLGCALALAGHTHGGQVRLPLFGTTVSGTAAGPLVASGVARLGRMWTITSNGTGAFFPLRTLCPPEIVVVELTSRA